MLPCGRTTSRTTSTCVGLCGFAPALLRAHDTAARAGIGHRRESRELLTAFLAVQSPPWRKLLLSAVWLGLEMLVFALGALVFWKRPGDAAARIFFTACILTVAAFIGGYHWSEIAGESRLLYPFVISAMLVPVVTLHFYLVFPRPKPWLVRRPVRTLLLVYGVPLVWTVAICGLIARGSWLYGQGAAAAEVIEVLETLRRLISWYLGVAAAWFLASIGVLVHSLRTSQTWRSGTR